jgi:hypothetical protein
MSATRKEARRSARWPKGVSGNPAGKRPGTRNRPRPRPLGELLRELAATEAGAILATLTTAAKAGDAVAAAALLGALTQAGQQARS